VTGIGQLGRDVGLAFRAIARMPALSAVVIVSLAAGIGVNTVVFSWLQALVLEPLPGVSHSSAFQLVEPRAETGSYPGMSWLEYRDVRERLPAFGDLIAFRMAPLNLGERGRTERTYGELVSGNYFTGLGMRPALGRLIAPDDAVRPGGAPVVVISDDCWRSHFGSASDTVGRIVRVNDRPLTIIGITPPGFQGTVVGLAFDMWVPATLAPVLLGGSRELDERGARGYSVMGRLAPNATEAQARTEFDAAMRDLARAYPETNATLSGEVLPFWQSPRGPQRLLGGALAILQGVMLLLLLAMCGNTANLVLARASARQREIGVRLALGARPWRIFSLLMTECLVLAIAGAAGGAALAVWGTEAFRAVPMIGAFPIRFQTHVDLAGLGFASVLGVLSGLAFGMAPAVQLARVDPQRALRHGARTSSRNPLRNALMGTEVALATIVLLVAGLFFESFSETRDVDPGFTREGVLLGAYDFTGRNPADAEALAFASRLLERLRAMPGVEAAAIASSVPLDIHGMPSRAFVVEGRAREDASADEALTNVVTPGYFRVMNIPLRAGRDFSDLRDPAAEPQAVVNEEFVHRYLDGIEPIGRRLQIRQARFTIVGVAKTTLYESFGEAPTPMIYLSYRDRPYARGEIHVRTRPNAESTLGVDLQRIVRDLDPSLPVYDIRTLTDHVEKNLFLRRIPARMFVVLGPLLLALAAIGIYAVVAYGVSQRRTEIALRLALGATGGRVVAQIVGESLRVIGVGALAGWMLALAVALHLGPDGGLTRVVFIGVPILLLIVAAVACWLPAQRATRISPMLALKQD
jgi:predicted permease